MSNAYKSINSVQKIIRFSIFVAKIPIFFIDLFYNLYFAHKYIHMSRYDI